MVNCIDSVSTGIARAALCMGFVPALAIGTTSQLSITVLVIGTASQFPASIIEVGIASELSIAVFAIGTDSCLLVFILVVREISLLTNFIILTTKIPMDMEATRSSIIKADLFLSDGFLLSANTPLSF